MRMLLFLASACLVISCSRQTSSETYPSRDITVYINSSQGGATDQWSRFLAGKMERELGVKMMCVNLPGAMGGAGAMKVQQTRPDGYTLLGCSESVLFLGVNKVGPTADKWRFLVAGGSPGVIAVLGSSPWENLTGFMASAQTEPGQLRISNSGNGKLWHLKAVRLEKGAGIALKHIPYNGSAPAITALLSGEVHAVSCSLPEIQEYVRSGKVRLLATTEAGPIELPGQGTLPSMRDAFQHDLEAVPVLRQWLGLAIPRDVPESVYQILSQAFSRVMTSEETKAWIRENHSELFNLSGEEADHWLAEMQQEAAWASQDAGLAKVNPETLGIPRP